MRRPVVAANWKMNKTVPEALDLTRDLLAQIQAYTAVERVICPALPILTAVAPLVAAAGVGLGAQNMHWENSGAYTGEVSPLMLAGLCQYVIVGHSERRQYFGETDETVNRKLRAALDVALTPIMCVGESLAHRESGETAAWLTEQVTVGLRDLSPGDLGNLVVAYEPIWAIGTGRA